MDIKQFNVNVDLAHCSLSDVLDWAIESQRRLKYAYSQEAELTALQAQLAVEKDNVRDAVIKITDYQKNLPISKSFTLPMQIY